MQFRYEPRSVFRSGVLTTRLSQRDTSGGPFQSNTWLSAPCYQTSFCTWLIDPLWKSHQEAMKLCLAHVLGLRRIQAISYPSLTLGARTRIHTATWHWAYGNDQVPSTENNPRLLIANPPAPQDQISSAVFVTMSLTGVHACQHPSQESRSEHFLFQPQGGQLPRGAMTSPTYCMPRAHALLPP